MKRIWEWLKSLFVKGKGKAESKAREKIKDVTKKW